MKLRVLSCFLLVLLPLAAAAREDAPRTRTEYYSAYVSVDAAGRVTGAEMLGDVPRAVRNLLQDTARKVEFEPARKGGVPVPSRTSLTLKMSLEQAGNGDYFARVVDVGGGSVAFDKRRRVPFPGIAASAGYGAGVLVRLSIRADGKVDMANSRIERVALARHGKPSDDAARRESFEKAVLRAVAKWTFAVEEVDGQPLATRVLVPVSFCPQASCADWPIDVLSAADARPAPQDADVQLARPREPAPDTKQAP
ncbi:hypothetical protein [Arenimonas sp.]|uniref:hypothetical protein n=1 Tax=Arenimonas sp. TaxID=1872635 RepID=UPI0035B016DC